MINSGRHEAHIQVLSGAHRHDLDGRLKQGLLQNAVGGSLECRGGVD